MTYYVDVFSTLRKQLHRVNDSHLDEIENIYDLIERYSSLSSMYQSVITDLIDGYISLNGHRLNQIMKVLTIVTGIFVPLTLLVGIYGMNFENMPELKSEHGYYVLLTTMSCVSLLMLYIFRRVRWL